MARQKVRKKVYVKERSLKEMKAAMETQSENDRQSDSEGKRKKGGQRELAFHY